MAKMYFAEFTNTQTGKVFQKFGHTQFRDAQERLNRITEEFPQYESRILAHVYHHDVERCIEIEEEFKARYPKNFWLEEKLSGITETVVLSKKDRFDIITELRIRNAKMKEELYG